MEYPWISPYWKRKKSGYCNRKQRSQFHSRCALSKRSQSLQSRPASPLSPTFGFWSLLLGTAWRESGNLGVWLGLALQHLQSVEGNGFAELFFHWPPICVGQRCFNQVTKLWGIAVWIWRPQGQELQSISFTGNLEELLFIGVAPAKKTVWAFQLNNTRKANPKQLACPSSRKSLLCMLIDPYNTVYAESENSCWQHLLR